jgi:hypothetical protein
MAYESIKTVLSGRSKRAAPKLKSDEEYGQIIGESIIAASFVKQKEIQSLAKIIKFQKNIQGNNNNQVIAIEIAPEVSVKSIAGLLDFDDGSQWSYEKIAGSFVAEKNSQGGKIYVINSTLSDFHKYHFIES